VNIFIEQHWQLVYFGNIVSCGFFGYRSGSYSLIGAGPDAGSEDLQAALREQASQE
jgi:hypothetical protein